jgi:co-chaperonin GroES (HSP10)
MKIKAVGHRVIVIPDKVVEKTKSGIVIAKDVKREAAGAQKGTVYAVGSMAWKNEAYGFTKPGWEPWCKEGDRVYFARYAAKFFTDESTDTTYGIMNDEDIQCVILDEEAIVALPDEEDQ